MPKDIMGIILPKPEDKGRKKKEPPIQMQETQRKKVRNKAWAVMIQQVWEIDPLQCVRCGGRMKLIAFIQKSQPEVIHAFLESLKIEIPDLEERTRGPPRWRAMQQAHQFVQAHPQAYPEENLDQTAHINEEDYFINPP